MIRVVQHIPDYVDGVTPERATVATQAALLALPWVHDWAKHVYPLGAFSQWSVSDRRRLMAEYDDGRKWWVVAHILDGADLLTLPPWVSPHTRN